MKDLRFFITQFKVKKLYREFVKIIYRSKDLDTRREFVDLVKNEFLAHKDVQDLSKIDYYLATGRQKLDYVENMINMTQ